MISTREDESSAQHEVMSRRKRTGGIVRSTKQGCEVNRNSDVRSTEYNFEAKRTKAKCTAPIPDSEAKTQSRAHSAE